MAGTAVIALEGVLRAPSGQPIPEGVALYHALKTTHKVVIVADDLSRVKAEHWLRTEGLRDHVLLVCADVAKLGGEVRYEQLRYLNGIALRPDIIVEPSPARCAKALTAGYTTLLFSQPAYARPEWRADTPRGVQSWASITEELERQAEQKSSDPRVDAEGTRSS